MSTEPSTTTPRVTVEQGLASVAGDVRKNIRQQISRCERKIREKPLKAIGVAVVAGYCLHRLPMRAILIAKVRVLTALAPPALLAVGAAKLCETLQKKAASRLP